MPSAFRYVALCENGGAARGEVQPPNARATALSAATRAVMKPAAIAVGTSCEIEASTSVVARPPIQAETFRPKAFRRSVRRDPGVQHDLQHGPADAQCDLELGEVASIKALARREGLCNHYTSRMLPLAYLAPDLVEAILAGRQPRGVSLAALTAQPLPMAWLQQRALFARSGSIAG